MTAVGVSYNPSNTLRKFLKDDSFIRCVIGPFGSGKSSACSIELPRRAAEQAPGPDGIRRTRWVVVRNTYRELADTTRKTFEDWIPASMGQWHEGSNTFFMRFNDVQSEILFRALDRPDDVKKLLSLEVTGAWINEAREIPRSVFEVLQARVGRYPSKLVGGATWFGIWMDTNPPDVDHWIYRLFVEERPSEFAFYQQPGGLSPLAENVENLPDHYYERLQQGKTAEWIKVFVHGQFGFVSDGKPVYPEFKLELHSDPKLITLPDSFPILLGVDFGLTPAGVIAQQDSDGQLQVIDELVTDDMGAVRFAERFGTLIRNKYRGHVTRGWGDPAGMQRSQVDERTPYDILLANNLPVSPTHTNDWQLRRETIGTLLTRLTMRGRPALAIHPRCNVLLKAMGGGYCMRRLQIGSGERFADFPDKGRFSHVAEALQYLAVGEGLDSSVLDGPAGPGRTVSLRHKVIRSAGDTRRRDDPHGW